MKEQTIEEQQKEVARIANLLSMYCDQSDGDVDYDVQELLEMVDLEDVMETGYRLCAEGENEELLPSLQKLIACLNYLDYEAGIATTVSDDVYDRVVELLQTKGVDRGVLGTPVQTSTRLDVREHQYPILRGSLKKVHFCEQDEIPKHDSRKSLEEYLRNTLEQLPEETLQNILKEKGSLLIQANFKYDGQSAVFECKGKEIQHVLTRYKVDQNLGKDITHVFSEETLPTLFPYDIPMGYMENTISYGIQTEIVMTHQQFQQYQEYTGDKKCNRRSAVSSILNQTKENFDPKLRQFLTVIPLQIACAENLAQDDCEETYCQTYGWWSLGYVGDHFLWVSYDLENTSLHIDLTQENFHVSGKEDYATLAKSLCNFFPAIRQHAEERGIPIDGVVFTSFDDSINHRLSATLGRSRDKNNFQVAFKFPAGIAKTTLQSVVFQVGPLGNITPVAEFAPVTMNGNCLRRTSLSNMEKLERLQLHEGDEILIQYDIIPKIMVDETCKKNEQAPLIVPIDHCPICGEPLDPKAGYRCLNWDCDSKLVGRIFNYVKKMNIPGFGLDTIYSLYQLGVLHSIEDLYLLGAHRSQLVDAVGLGDVTASKLITAPMKRTHIYPHELLGALGIPSISLHTMDKVCRAIPLENLVNAPEVILQEYPRIPSIGEKTAKKIAEGLERCKEEILHLLPWFTFLHYNDQSKHVVFHTVRDKAFEQWLLQEKGIASTSGITNAEALIVSDEKPEDTDKIKRAKEHQVPVLTLTEAKKKWGYSE